MKNIILLLFIIFATTSSTKVEILPSCNELLSDILIGSNQWSAKLDIPVPVQSSAGFYEGYNIRITFSQPVYKLENNLGILMTTVDDETFIIRSNEYQINNTLTMYLFAENNLNTIFNIQQILYNNIEVCKDKPAIKIKQQDEKYLTCSKFLINEKLTSNKWNAILKFPIPIQPNPDLYDGWHLKLTFNLPIINLRHNESGVIMSTIDDKNIIMRSSDKIDIRILKEHNFIIQLTVNFNTEDHKPLKLSGVRYNNILICEGDYPEKTEDLEEELSYPVTTTHPIVQQTPEYQKNYYVQPPPTMPTNYGEEDQPPAISLQFNPWKLIPKPQYPLYHHFYYQHPNPSHSHPVHPHHSYESPFLAKIKPFLKF